VIGWVGRFVPQKDPQSLADAIARILKIRQDAVAVLIGDGPRRREVAGRLHEYAHRVHFAGIQKDARRLYAAFDVLLHPSLWEGQPLVVQEALSERIPVVMSRVASSHDLIRDGVNGFVVDPGNGAAVAERALVVLDTDSLRPPLGTNAVRHLADRTGSGRCVEAHRALYRRLLTAVT
jgi:glycosyltransferase involved in cell wall biosynthesis